MDSPPDTPPDSMLSSEPASEVKLYVKAGADGQRYGACPFCQRVFMILMLKAQAGHLRFQVVTVNLSKPPEEFRTRGLKHVPALIHGETAHDLLDDILQYVDDVFPSGQLLEYENVAAEACSKNVFSKFCFFVKEVARDGPNALLAELTKLDGYLQRHLHEERHFLCGDRLTHLDCELLPKLQHLRVAAARLKGWEIPARLQGVWRYLHRAYAHPVFAVTCPADQEIVLHWADKPETPNLSFEQHALMVKETPRFSFDVPAVAYPVAVIATSNTVGETNDAD